MREVVPLQSAQIGSAWPGHVDNPHRSRELAITVPELACRLHDNDLGVARRKRHRAQTAALSPGESADGTGGDSDSTTGRPSADSARRTASSTSSNSTVKS